jgi:hypothetical protein
LGDSLTNEPFNPIVFTIYDAWKGLRGGGTNSACGQREERNYSTQKLIQITAFPVDNDEPAFGNPAVVNGTCTTS